MKCRQGRETRERQAEAEAEAEAETGQDRRGKVLLEAFFESLDLGETL
jgi:hypothetical protein